MKFPRLWQRPARAPQPQEKRRGDVRVSLRPGYDASGYYAEKILSRDGISSMGSAWGTDRRRDYDRAKLVEYSRKFYDDNGIYTGMIGRAAGYIVGNGFGLQARTGDQGWNAAAESLWREYWPDAEIRGVHAGRQVERILCQELLITGEMFALLLGDGHIQAIESEQVCKSGGDGIDVDKYGKPIRYWVAPYVAGRVDISHGVAHQASNVIYATRGDRPAVLRSKPPCQASFPMLHRINDVCNSEAAAWQLLSRFAMAVLRENGADAAYNESVADSSKLNSDGEIAGRIQETDYALIYHGEPGEDVKGIERNIPGQNFSESITMFMRLLGLPLGMPLEIILLDWTKSNYSQSRAVLEQAYQTFLAWQYLMEDRLYRTVYRWKINQWIGEGLLSANADAFKHEWIKPTFPWLDQLKEAQAYALRLDRSLVTHGMVCKSIGMERDDVVAIREAEIMDAIERAQRIEAATGRRVPWETFCGMKYGERDYASEPSRENDSGE